MTNSPNSAKVPYAHFLRDDAIICRDEIAALHYMSDFLKHLSNANPEMGNLAEEMFRHNSENTSYTTRQQILTVLSNVNKLLLRKDLIVLDAGKGGIGAGQFLETLASIHKSFSSLGIRNDDPCPSEVDHFLFSPDDETKDTDLITPNVFSFFKTLSESIPKLSSVDFQRKKIFLVSLEPLFSYDQIKEVKEYIKNEKAPDIHTVSVLSSDAVAGSANMDFSITVVPQMMLNGIRFEECSKQEIGGSTMEVIELSFDQVNVCETIELKHALIDDEFDEREDEIAEECP